MVSQKYQYVSLPSIKMYSTLSRSGGLPQRRDTKTNSDEKHGTQNGPSSQFQTHWNSVTWLWEWLLPVLDVSYLQPARIGFTRAQKHSTRRQQAHSKMRFLSVLKALRTQDFDFDPNSDTRNGQEQNRDSILINAIACRNCRINASYTSYSTHEEETRKNKTMFIKTQFQWNASQ